MPCSSSKDAYGTTFVIAEAGASKPIKGGFLRGCPSIDVWWSRDSNKKSTNEETLIIRQEYADRDTADVLELTFAQVYDLIDALNKAVEDY